MCEQHTQVDHLVANPRAHMLLNAYLADTEWDILEREVSC